MSSSSNPVKCGKCRQPAVIQETKIEGNVFVRRVRCTACGAEGPWFQASGMAHWPGVVEAARMLKYGRSLA